MFFVAVYALTWTCFFGAAALGGSAAQPRLIGMIALAGVFAPAIVALVMTAWDGGGKAVIDLLRPLIRWRVGLRWYLFAAGYMIVIKLTAAVLCRIGTGVWPRFGNERPIVMAAATVMSVLLGGQTGEEIGWRGYALPSLASRFGLGTASIVLGVFWACWHLPLFFVLGGDTVGQSFPLYLLQVTAISVAMAFLWSRTSGSLLLTMLMHSAGNNTKDIVPSAVSGAHNPFALSTSTVAWVSVALMWLCAVVCLTTMRSNNALPVVADLTTGKEAPHSASQARSVKTLV